MANTKHLGLPEHFDLQAALGATKHIEDWFSPPLNWLNGVTQAQVKNRSTSGRDPARLLRESHRNMTAASWVLICLRAWCGRRRSGEAAWCTGPR